jgi:hypothetical protein
MIKDMGYQNVFRRTVEGYPDLKGARQVEAYRGEGHTCCPDGSGAIMHQRHAAKRGFLEECL